MSFRTASAILRGRWLIDKGWVQHHLPLIVKMMKGETVDLGLTKDDSKEIQALSHQAGTVYKVSYFSDVNMLPPNSIAMLQIVGPVTKYGDICSYGSIDHTATIGRLASSQNVVGIILSIDSPGGEVSGTAMLADAIKAAAMQKPVIAVIDDGIAASAAMWIASAAKEIYTTQKTDMVGSVGVYTTIVDWYGYLEAQGLKARDIYAPQSTEKNLDYLEALKGNDELIKAELKVIADEFIGVIKANRGDRLTSDAWNKGAMFYSADAKKIGLIDGQKSFDQVIKRMDELIKQEKSNSNSNSNTYSMKWPNLANLLGKKEVATAAETQIEEKHGDDIEATILERDNLKTANASLQQEKENLASENASLKTKVSEHETTIGTLNSEKENLSNENASLKTRIEELEKQDGTTGAAIVTENDTDPVDTEVNANDMDFQKRLYEKI